MNTSEFLSSIKSRGAKIFSRPDKNTIDIVNTSLQDMRAAMMPTFLHELYTNCSAITFGSACIFGVTEINRGIKYPLPAITDINKEICTNKNLYGKTVFGRNDLFWFATDAFGNCFMLDNVNLSVLRKYDDPYRAMMDCLIIGKI